MRYAAGWTVDLLAGAAHMRLLFFLRAVSHRCTYCYHHYVKHLALILARALENYASRPNVQSRQALIGSTNLRPPLLFFSDLIPQKTLAAPYTVFTPSSRVA